MHLESPTVTVNKSAENLFDFLTDVKNFKVIMPKNIDKFEATENAFNFALKGMPNIKLKLESQEPPNKIVLASASDKFPFTLTGNINVISKDSSSIKLDFKGNFNPMMTMMIKGPLQKFINTLSKNMTGI